MKYGHKGDSLFETILFLCALAVIGFLIWSPGCSRDGRYRLYELNNAVFRIDTQTGKTWRYGIDLNNSNVLSWLPVEDPFPPGFFDSYRASKDRERKKMVDEAIKLLDDANAKKK